MHKKQIEKILLVQPPLTTHIDLSTEPKGIHPPIGLAYIASVLEKDYDVRILDSVVEGYETEIQLDKNRIQYGLTLGEIQERIDAFSPDVLGVSVRADGHEGTACKGGQLRQKRRGCAARHRFAVNGGWAMRDSRGSGLVAIRL